jgi:hypothetical protein
MIELVSSRACHGDAQCSYLCESREIALPMRFSFYLPP